ncbi:putative proteasome subunit alpha type 6 [Phaeomoniella chlamydospora]|uniref:Putative proteasome subunit alpha type 6 n=1 Tax=Phaeomoniella chlamydospora TaxID=158046 RepID=A0A0G2E7W6_PHACM|nr:putative proteasome subunit alpha type 6 [Phaeomoniella chlamydospora]
MSRGPENGANGQLPLGTTAQRLPAWKRLGLKLKSAEDSIDERSPISDALHVTSPGYNADNIERNTSHSVAKKRKLSSPDPDSTPSDGVPSKSPSALKKQSQSKKKRVSFAAETKTEDGDTAVSISPADLDLLARTSSNSADTPAQPKKPKKAGKIKKTKSTNSEKPHSALQYLSQYHESRDTWKFNKNKETWLLKHIFSTADLPSSYDKALATYLGGLRGESAKSRLAQGATEEVSNVDDHLASTSQASQSMDDPATRDAYRAEARKRFKRNHEQFLDDLEKQEAEEPDPDRQRLLARRRRAEIILWSVGVDTQMKASINGDSDPASNLKGESKRLPSSHEISTGSQGVKKRRSKTRTATVDLSDSSSSSESESDTSDDETESTATAKSTSTSPHDTRTTESDSDSETTSDSESDSSSESDPGSEETSDDSSESDSD